MNTTNLRSGAPVPFKRLARPSLGKMLQPEASGTANIQVPYLKAGHVQWHGVDLPEDLPLMWASHSDVKDLTPAPGDLLICEGGEVGRAALAPDGLPENTIIQNSLHLVRETDSACPRYLKYALEHVAASGWIDLICNKATIAHLTVDKLRELPIPFWNKQDQQRIANFLDEKTARIDALIAEKQALLDSLKKHQYSYASELMTKGQDSTAQLAETSHPELGSIPAHWAVKRLKFLGEVRSGIAKGKDHGERDTVLMPYLRVANVQDGYVDLTTVLEIEVGIHEVERYLLCRGDVLMNEGGDNDKLGRGTVWEGQIAPCVHQNHVFAVRLFDPSLAEWVARFTSTDSARNYFFLRSKQSTNLASINQSNVRELPVPMPPKEEREAILAELQRASAANEELTTHVVEHLSRLREYRSSLISAAVTGQLDLSTFKKAVQ